MARIFKAYTQPVRYIPKKKQHEASLQKEVCRFLRVQWPNVIFRSDYSSGMKLTINQAAVHKSLQSSRAWPDLFICQPSRGFHGLFIELKKEGTTIYATRGANKGQLVADEHIREQAMMLERLNQLGYCARFSVGFDHTIELINWYLNENYVKRDNATLF